ncbi:MAG: hypothetical protein ACI379_00860 [Nocardioides sp.]|uniref:hypothetical protein n=1 Tax=Nocardioides sp. TaxID=35761 RepID=UPI003F056AE7
MESDLTAQPAAPAAERPGRGWAWTGVAAGLTGILAIYASMGVDGVYRPELAGNAEGITAALAEDVSSLLVFHVATMVTVVLVPVFAAGLRRRLAGQTPAGSLVPDVAAFGLLLVAVAGLMGTALNTEFIFGLSEPDQLVPEVAVLYGHWVGTVSWLWVGAGLTGLAVGVAALRHGAAARWLGWVCGVLGALTALLGVSPLQYMAGFTGPVLLLVMACGFALGDRTQIR